MHPPADVEPAIVSMMEQLSSASMVLKICAADARSREVNDMLPMLSMIGRASKDVMSMCSISCLSRSALRLEACFMASVPFAAGSRGQAPPGDDLVFILAEGRGCARHIHVPPVEQARRPSMAICKAAGQRCGARHTHERLREERWHARNVG